MTDLSDDAAVVFNGFLGLKNLEKLALVEAINEYFDSDDKEGVRAAADARFAERKAAALANGCKCCGR